MKNNTKTTAQARFDLKVEAFSHYNEEELHEAIRAVMKTPAGIDRDLNIEALLQLAGR